MTMNNCGCRCVCTAAALVVSAILGVLTAFFQITGMITVTTVFLWVAFGIAVVYLVLLLAGALLERNTSQRSCTCSALNTLLAGILGTILLSVVLLAVGITATSVISAIGVGLLVFFFALMLTATACLVRSLTDCANE